MRKSFILFFLFLYLFHVVNSQTLCDPNFEGLSCPVGTGPWEPWLINDAVASVSTETSFFHNGAASKKVIVNTLGSDGQFFYKQSFNFQKGKIYSATVWLKSTADRVLVEFVLHKTPAGSADIIWPGACMRVNVGPEWQKVTIIGGFDFATAGFVGINFLSAGVLYVDEATLTDITSSVHNQPPSLLKAIPGEYFGIHKNKIASPNQYLPPIESGLLRLWDSSTLWRDVEPSTGYDPLNLNAYLSAVEANNDPDYKVIYTMGQTPHWALASYDVTKDPDPIHGYGPGHMMPPFSLSDWDAYVSRIATNYKGKIHYFEIWNEVNVRDMYGGTMEKLVEMTRRAREVLKAIDPEVKIISPNFALHGLSALNAFLALGGGQHVDIFAFHNYFSATPEDGLTFISAVKNVLKNHGQDHKPLWNTEGAAYKPGVFSPEQESGALARLYLLHWAYGVSNFNWYAFDIITSDRVNIATLDGATYIPSPQGYAYKEIARWLKGASMVSKSVSGNVWTIEITRDGGYRAWIAWSTAGNIIFNVPSGATQYRTLTSPGSNPQPLNASNFLINHAPVLFETNTNLSIVRYSVVNAATGTIVPGYENLQSNAVLALGNLPSSLTIEAHADSPLTESVVFNLDGTTFSTQNSPPFAINGNNGANYVAWAPTIGNHTLKATPHSSDNGSGIAGSARELQFTVIDNCSTGSILREKWNDLAGPTILSLKDNPLFPYYPSSTEYLTSFESTLNESDNYGARIRGYVCPPLTGEYIFWIAGDNAYELLLSSDANPKNATRIAGSDNYTGPREWDKYPEQQSDAVLLTAGKLYYIEAYHKETSLTDHLAVGWQLPNAALERPIPGMRLTPWHNFESNTTTGRLLREKWNNIGGGLLTDLTDHALFPASPTSASFITQFESDLNDGDSYGARIRGYVHPPTTGDYTFYIAGDNAYGLWLSPTDDPDGKVKVAGSDNYTGPREYDKYPGQQTSPAIHLVAGRKYYIEALHKENSQADHVSVGWPMPGNVSELPIPTNRISPWMGNTVARIRSTRQRHADLTEQSSTSRSAPEIFPNPFSDVFKLNYTLEAPAFVNIAIYNLNGAKVQGIVSMAMQVGFHSIEVDGSNLPAGVYCCKIVTGNKQKTIRLIKI